MCLVLIPLPYINTLWEEYATSHSVGQWDKLGPYSTLLSEATLPLPEDTLSLSEGAIEAVEPGIYYSAGLGLVWQSWWRRLCKLFRVYY